MDQALDAAMDAFWTHGYEATSLADLMEATGLKKGSIYKAFADKHTLFMQALERYLDGMHQRMQQAVEEADSPRAGIRAWMRMAADMCQCQDVQRGCLALNTAVELGPHDTAAAALLERHHAWMARFLTATVERGQARGEFRDDLPAEQLAKSLLVFGAGLLAASKALSPKEIDPQEMAEFALRLLS